MSCPAFSDHPHAALYLSQGPRMRYYVLECMGPELPWTELYMLPENKLLTVLDNNTAIRERAAEMAWPQVRSRSLVG